INGPYTISASAGPNGSISPSGSVSVACGGSQTFTITPNANFRVSTVVVDGVSAGYPSSYTFISVSGNHTISASFLPKAVKVVHARGAQANGNGPYPVPSAGGPWVDLGHGHHDFTLQNFPGTLSSGWVVDGTAARPY